MEELEGIEELLTVAGLRDRLNKLMEDDPTTSNKPVVISLDPDFFSFNIVTKESNIIKGNFDYDGEAGTFEPVLELEESDSNCVCINC